MMISRNRQSQSVITLLAMVVLLNLPAGSSHAETGSASINLIISKDVGGRQAELDRLAATIRQERDSTPFELNQQCPNQQASRIRKEVVVAGFNVEDPDQTVFGGLGAVGRASSKWLYRNLLETGEVLPLSAPGRQMFASLQDGATRAMEGNTLEQYSVVSRQMGAQFVVSGIIRSLNVNRPDSWDSSYAASIKRSLFSADTDRAFVVDVVLHDGYTGRVVYEQRYEASGRWDIPRTGKVGFGSPVFNESEYGTEVGKLFDEITDDLMSAIDCQALLVRVLQVDGKDLLLDVGTKSGLLPGDKLRLVRAQSALQWPDAPPKLWDTGVDLHLHQLSLDTSRAWMPQEGGVINIREGDYAVIY
jgi:Flagellar assembly protein T, middle domain